MSASREKKARQERGNDYVSPKEEKARKEKSATRRTTALFVVFLLAVVLFVVGLQVWNSGVIQRGAGAARINGETFKVTDVAYYYYNIRSNLLSSGSVDNNSSLRDQEYMDGMSWFDNVSDQALNALAAAELTAKLAKESGFDGTAEVEQSVSEALSSLDAAAASYGYSPAAYLKAIFGSTMTRAGFERNTRIAALADAFNASRTSAAGYTDAELQAKYDEDPSHYDMVNYESVIFYASDFETEDAEAAEGSDPALDGAKAAADELLIRFKAGADLEKAAEDAEGSYVRSVLYAGSSEMSDWLFDDARKDGDATVLDYFGAGYVLVVFHSREIASFHTVSVRHILVADEATANDVLAQYRSGAQTEDAFAALAQENSTDNASDGGLYTGVYLGQMVQPFEDWCFDPARQPGDTGIVETNYGYHVMYFVETSPYTYWQELAAQTLGSEMQASVTEDVNIERLDGMKYIDP